MGERTDGIARLLQRARAWRDADSDPATRAELDERIRRVEGGSGAQAEAAADGGDVTQAGQAIKAESASEAEAVLRSCFDPPLSFGTAGLRGLAGPGPAHMNALLIQRVTAVIADVLIAEVPDAVRRGVVIGYDARHGSQALAEAAARTVAGAGIGVHTFDGYSPTPLAAFATLELEAAAGLVLTASHNPPEYLGYKVYWSNAAQLVSPLDERIARALAALPLDARLPTTTPEQPGDAPYWQVHGDALRRRYLEAIARPRRTIPQPQKAIPRPQKTIPRSGEGAATATDPSGSETSAEPVASSGSAASAGPATLRIAYSAMHGVGGELLKTALANQGDIELHEVADQAAPDGDFPTVNFPNPEEPGALDRLTRMAAMVEADLALATDPDADRLAVAIPDAAGDWQVLMGDQIGALMADYLLACRAADAERGGASPAAGAMPAGFVVNTVVSSRLLGRIAEHYGVGFEQTLTGFKWIWHRALQREAAGEQLIFAYEDAIGFCPTRQVRDKDGIAAGVVMAELARDTLASGRSLHQRLMGLYARFGVAVNRQVSLKLEGADAHERMTRQLAGLRACPPASLDGLPVRRVFDYAGAESFQPGEAVPADAEGPQANRIPSGSRRERLDAEPIALPNTDLIQLAFDECLVSIRPSGTEPKLKVYLEYLGDPGQIGAPDQADEPGQGDESDQTHEAARSGEPAQIGGVDMAGEAKEHAVSEQIRAADRRLQSLAAAVESLLTGD
ncbi:phospho-sugar mutase [Spiribacter pallidus]|uniref:phospho-sugar mutase n=1 Tax=Spiribacter pallidus TaxID=1987936 RepID=UPI0034A094D7